MRRRYGNNPTSILRVLVPPGQGMDDYKKRKDKVIMNSLVIIGNLTGAPELRVTSQGTPVCTFTVAVNRRKENPDGSHDADFFRVTAWSKTGENCARFLDKGRKVMVRGAVSVHEWETESGKHGATLEVTAEDVEFLSPRVSDDAPPTRVTTTTNGTNVPAGFAPVETDELPFD